MTANPAAMDFLLTRRSRPAKMLQAPAPDGAQLLPLLQAAARVPDHGKLEPWRFVVLERAACARLAPMIAARGAEQGIAEEKALKAAATFAQTPLVVAVVASPKPSDKIPEIEQTLSVGAVCLGLVNAALASGWGANWLTGWVASDRAILQEMGLAPQEWVAGFVHIGTAQATPPDRPRPDIAALTTWIRE
ncbi:nitroreductase [Roseinatronobacter thiooxidans]|uniref:Putative NAD(P)H nitroreductase n=1 Tax=Roseinatronobacter thiooxidans TaxID=121821 RepID=A0A2W7QC24_9RHOB|nr:nitroreductase [Roseinatronobacter thiooxidans]PZX46148.1 nitroreductase [Roseinatronobacter thiooxidans]